MTSQILWQRAFPHVIITLGFLILSLAYMSPVFEGKRLIQNDIVQAEGAAHELKTYQQETGKRSFWANNMFSGMPAFMIVMDYPLSLPAQIARLIANALPTPANTLFLYMLGFYVMGLLFGFSAWQASAGSLLYALGSYNVINVEAGHMSKVFALAFAAPLIGAVYYAYNRNWWLGTALAGLFASLQLYANHVQITYYVFLTLLLFAIYQAVQCTLKKAEWKQFALASAGLAVAGALALGAHASRLWTTYEYSTQTIRGKSELKSTKETESGATDKSYAFAWSYGVSESFTFLIPNFYGSGSGAGKELGASSNTIKAFKELGASDEQAQQYAMSMPYYWGAQPFTSGPAYLGIIVCFLAFLGLLASATPVRWWLLSASILLVIIAWGKNFAVINDLFFQYLPLFNKFRAHTMTLSVLQIFVAGLAVLGLQAIFAEKADLKALQRKVYLSGSIIGGTCLLFALLGGALQDFKSNGTTATPTEGGKTKQVNNDQVFLEQINKSLGDNSDSGKKVLRAVRADRASMQSADAWRSVGFVLVGVGILWAFTAGFMTWMYALGAIAFIGMVDLWGVDRRYLNTENFKAKSDYDAVYSTSEAEGKVLQDDTRYRVMNTNANVFNDAVTSYNFPSVGGYSGAKLRRYQDVIDSHFSRNTPAVMDMLNVKYVFTTNEKKDDVATIKNPTACGNAWFVGDYELVASPDAELAALTDLKPLKKAVIDKRFASQVGKVQKEQDAVGKIKLTKALPDVLEYETDNAQAQIAVFSEIYYVQEGKLFWQAYLDGKPVSHFRANYILRGLAVPAGKHKITFKFEVPLYYKGEMIAFICSIILLAGIGVASYLYYKENIAKV